MGLALLASAGAALAVESPADVIKARQQHLKNVGKAAKAVSDQLKTGAPDKAVVQASAADIARILKDMPTWFPAGTGPEAGVKTAAKPEIWAQSADFKAAYDKAQAAADKFVEVAATGDVKAETTGFMTLGMSCQGCHKIFRVKEEGQ